MNSDAVWPELYKGNIMKKIKRAVMENLREKLSNENEPEAGIFLTADY